MSVILYEDEKFLRIYETLRAKRAGQEFAHLWSYPEGWNLPGGMDTHYRAFAEDLRRANIITWNRQYENERESLATLDFDYGILPYESDIRFLKSLRGLRYNLFDNDGTETDLCNCLKKLNALIDEVSYDIISRIPEWETADTW